MSLRSTLYHKFDKILIIRFLPFLSDKKRTETGNALLPVSWTFKNNKYFGSERTEGRKKEKEVVDIGRDEIIHENVVIWK